MVLEKQDQDQRLSENTGEFGSRGEISVNLKVVKYLHLSWKPICFRLPFNDIISDLLKPSTLMPQINQGMQELTFYLHIIPQQATTTARQQPCRGLRIMTAVALVQKLTSSDLLQRLKAKGANHSDHTRGLIKEKLKEDADSEITTTCLRVSLICPLGKMRMTTPCRAITCNHLQCFDSSLFLQMNERKPTWCCPVCDKPALYDNLVIDGYFQEVLSSPTLPVDLNEIQLNKDGSWSSQEVDKKVTKSERVPIDDSIEIIADDVELVSSGITATSSTDKTKEDKSKDKVVDLTCSDSDDDEPLAKRRVINAKPDSTIKFSES